MIEQLANLITNQQQRWPDSWSLTDREWQQSTNDHGVFSLLADRIVHGQIDHCPVEIATELKQALNHSVAQELLRQHHLQQMLAHCAQARIELILIKGTPLAYSLYQQPYTRSRCDTDLLIQQADKDRLVDCLNEIDYQLSDTISGQLVSSQYCLVKAAGGGNEQVLDVHWQLSNRHAFSHKLQWHELINNCEPVNKLGPNARAPNSVYALLIACMHLAGHHHNQERLIWLVDIDLLVNCLSSQELKQFRSLVIDKGLNEICQSLLSRTAELFDNTAALQLAQQFDQTGRSNDPSALFTDPDISEWRRLLSDMKSLPNWQQRSLLVREHLLPPTSYMLKRFQTENHWLLPWLYLKRLIQGFGRLWRS